ISAVAVGSYHTVGLKVDGTVVAVGANFAGQCNVESWRDIVAIAANAYYTVGLKADGTVVAVGKSADDDDYQFNTNDWKNIGPVPKEQIQIMSWRAQGLCQNCGGKLSFFGNKCKSCN
ncbi:MAG: hypothetical protein FWG79_09225, partial [Bacteroidales bacterium]|nr:hypothetical protein [Bacteroidales bacterium]